MLKVVTHGAPASDIMSMYSSFTWQALCAEVAKLRVKRPKKAKVLDFASHAAATKTRYSDVTATEKTRKNAALASDPNGI